VFENAVLTRIFVPNREEVAGDSRRLHNEELHNLYASLNVTMVIKIKENETDSAHGRDEK
jgi:hypothetical protein